MAHKILCVAEKPSIAKAVAGHLGGGSVHGHSIPGLGYVRNYNFEFNFGPPWGHCEVTMTSVVGHLTNLDFPANYKDWKYPPPDSLFDAPVRISIEKDENKAIAKNIETQARFAKALFIWTDCDREGEHIGREVKTAAFQGNPHLEVKRAKFSNIERAHVIRAAKQPVELDERQADAVAARIELDLRTGAAFTRLQTNILRNLGGELSKKTISYGSCQFPTLGFVVDRYFKVRNFIPEPFWGIRISHERDGLNVTFHWNRNHLFDRAAVTILFERCLAAKVAKVSKVQEKPTKKWKPLPLTTVEFQKMATRFLHITSKDALDVAEKLYQQGAISYPRTETDRFDRGMDLKALVAKHTHDSRWGPFAQNLVDSAFQQPREGRNDDKAHPPIHPIANVAHGLNPTESRVYELITRRFLACCSEDAKGTATDIEIELGDEKFHAHGVIVLERNYLDVYPYERWTGNILPKFTLGEEFEPKEAIMTDGKTTAPKYLTEPELISLMDANGIGTDATMAEHINKIRVRDYVVTRMGVGGMEEFIPTTLGVALVEGYENVGFETSLTKPFLRKEMELRMKDICEGRATKADVVGASVRQYKQVYYRTEEQIGLLKAACRKYIFGHQRSAGGT